MKTLKEANDEVQKYRSELQSMVDDVLVDDIDFFKSAIDQYSVSVIPDLNSENKEEPDFGTMFPLSYYNQYVTSSNDVLVQYIHVMGHKKCMSLWKKCPVNRNLFTQYEIDFIEEMYNQRLFIIVAPAVYHPFYLSYIRYSEYLRFKNKLMREVIDTLLTKDVHPNLTKDLSQIHSELYKNNPLNQNIFNAYVFSWQTLLAHKKYKELMELYNAR